MILRFKPENEHAQPQVHVEILSLDNLKSITAFHCNNINRYPQNNHYGLAVLFYHGNMVSLLLILL